MSDGEYPKWMHHPHEQPAVLSDDYEVGPRPPLHYSARPGQARKFPPVQVHDRHQEAYHAAQGYRVGASQKAAFVPRPMPHSPYPAVPVEPQAPPLLDPRRWPKWLHRAGKESQLVRTPEQATDVLARWDAEDKQTVDVEPIEAPARTPRAASTAQRKKPRGSASGFALRGALMREAKALGLKPDPKWKLADVRRAIEEKRHEGQSEAA